MLYTIIIQNMKGVRQLGSVLKSVQLTAELLKKATIPIILCAYSARIAQLIDNGRYNNINLNIELAEALLRLPPSQRSKRANDEIMNLISKCSDSILLTDYEILFDPRYDLDVIKVFNEISRRQKVVVKWRGTFNGNYLEYATPEHQDYHSFRIADYDIICVN